MSRAIVAVVGTRAGSVVGARVLPSLDRGVWRASRGRHTLSSLLTDLPVILLTTTGARTGRPRTVPLLGIVDGDEVVVVASDFASAHHPDWLHNLRADPNAGLAWGRRPRASRQSVTAVEIPEGPERERLWAQAVAAYPPWAAYERRTARLFPMLRLCSSA